MEQLKEPPGNSSTSSQTPKIAADSSSSDATGQAHTGNPDKLEGHGSIHHADPVPRSTRASKAGQEIMSKTKQDAILDAMKSMIGKMSALKEQMHLTRCYIIAQNGTGKPIFRWTHFTGWRKLRTVLDELYIAEGALRSERDKYRGVTLPKTQTAAHLNRGRTLATTITTIVTKNREILEIHELRGWEAAIDRSQLYNVKQKERLKKRVAGELKIFNKYMNLGSAAVYSATDLLEELAIAAYVETEHSSGCMLGDEVDEGEAASDLATDNSRPVARNRRAGFRMSCFCFCISGFFLLTIAAAVSFSVTVHEIETRLTALEMRMNKFDGLHGGNIS
ncbi:hypothetical protein P154DRAFT_593016 [Amniculicola lignicola CBS 123094]|uniref:Uncharacterized protein n=1 Tax=Amniculicola lignicola CBS 123094 TaxID=1392246 RepID=A0A6A5X3R4_9PLEO|nr:hypothetical protein P154DRAFT_593016 [Amniculicola lignicola CBS 123094]